MMAPQSGGYTSPAAPLDAYYKGIQLFNDGAYWHAHEQWEQCWLASEEPESTFYKGIIQAAAALVHWQKGNLRGLQRNWEKSRPKLVAVLPLVQQLDLAGLITDMDRFVSAKGLVEWVPRLRLHIKCTDTGPAS